MFDERSGTDYAVVDPPFLDPEFPPQQFVTHFMSGGSAVHATIWIAQGEAPKGCVVLSPQVFGGDRLESLIIPLMASGIHVITFHPRGMWDGKHTYSFPSAIEDVHAAVDFVRTSETERRRTPGGRTYRIDPDRIAVLGLSGGGGNVGWAACAENPHLKFGIAVAPGNFELHRTEEAQVAGAESRAALTQATAGRIDMTAMLGRMTPAEFDRISLIKLAPAMLSKTLLLVGGSRDEVAPVEKAHKPIARAFREAGSTRFSDVILEADHSFLQKRIALARLVISWLKTECGF